MLARFEMKKYCGAMVLTVSYTKPRKTQKFNKKHNSSLGCFESSIFVICSYIVSVAHMRPLKTCFKNWTEPYRSPRFSPETSAHPGRVHPYLCRLCSRHPCLLHPCRPCRPPAWLAWLAGYVPFDRPETARCPAGNKWYLHTVETYGWRKIWYQLKRYGKIKQNICFISFLFFLVGVSSWT